MTPLNGDVEKHVIEAEGCEPLSTVGKTIGSEKVEFLEELDDSGSYYRQRSVLSWLGYFVLFPPEDRDQFNHMPVPRRKFVELCLI